MTIKNRVKEYIKLVYTCPNYRKIIKALKSCKQKIVLFGTPAHGNLGDHAIALSELDFLKKSSFNRDIVEIPMPLLKIHRKNIRKLINNEDIVIISGGGWMGNLWLHNELTIREIILDYPTNRIVIFPQTLYYTNDTEGSITKKQSQAIFEKHKDLILTVRDLKSFECAKNMGFEVDRNLFFCPDMVVFGTLAQKLNKKDYQQTNKKTAIVCLRDDIEKKYNSINIRNVLEEASYLIKETTTVLGSLVPMKKREALVKGKINEFKMASIVVTDRLHAMLFSLLAGTPCVVFDNSTGKVFGVGEYLREHCLPVYLFDEMSLSKISEIETTKQEYFLSSELGKYFKKLESIINGDV